MRAILLLCVLSFLSISAFSQRDSSMVDSVTYRIITYDGVEYVGRILKSDPHEILVRIPARGDIYIPQYVIKEIIAVKQQDYNPEGEFIGEDYFATRYFLTTNGLPIKRGESYVQWNLYGPDFEFAIRDNFGVGIMSTWVGMPIIATAKDSFSAGKTTHIALGGLAGTGSWAAPEVGILLPYGTVSFGNRKQNIALSGGYGYYAQDGKGSGRALLSVAGITKISRKISLVFDSFIMLPGKSYVETSNQYVFNPTTGVTELQQVKEIHDRPGFAIVLPGIRWHQDYGKAFQFGFTGVYAEGEFLPFPVPMIQWYRSL